MCNLVLVLNHGPLPHPNSLKLVSLSRFFSIVAGKICLCLCPCSLINFYVHSLFLYFCPSVIVFVYVSAGLVLSFFAVFLHNHQSLSITALSIPFSDAVLASLSESFNVYNRQNPSRHVLSIKTSQMLTICMYTDWEWILSACLCLHVSFILGL